MAVPQLQSPDGTADDLLRDRADPRADGHGGRHQSVAGLGLCGPARRAQHRAVDREYRSDPFPAVRAGYALPPWPDGARGRAHPARLRYPLAAERGCQLYVGRPAELTDRSRPLEPVSSVDEVLSVASEGRRVAADIGDPRNG